MHCRISACLFFIFMGSLPAERPARCQEYSEEYRRAAQTLVEEVIRINKQAPIRLDFVEGQITAAGVYNTDMTLVVRCKNPTYDLVEAKTSFSSWLCGDAKYRGFIEKWGATYTIKIFRGDSNETEPFLIDASVCGVNPFSFDTTAPRPTPTYRSPSDPKSSSYSATENSTMTSGKPSANYSKPKAKAEPKPRVKTESATVAGPRIVYTTEYQGGVSYLVGTSRDHTVYLTAFKKNSSGRKHVLSSLSERLSARW